MQSNEERAADPRTTTLKETLIPIRSIDPTDDDFADLEPLRQAIGEARVVQLGEQSHQDGATFWAKARLIRFLHTRMGFDVLAWESGLYDCERIQQLLEAGNTSPQKALEAGIFPIWSFSGHVEPVATYVHDSLPGARPL